MYLPGQCEHAWKRTSHQNATRTPANIAEHGTQSASAPTPMMMYELCVLMLTIASAITYINMVISCSGVGQLGMDPAPSHHEEDWLA